MAPPRLQWKEGTVGSRPAVYGVAGEGTPLLFLHGWGLGAPRVGPPLAGQRPLWDWGSSCENGAAA